MSDSAYTEKLKRRQRLYMWGGGTVLVALICVLFVRGIYHDTCTNSFDRAPNSVILSYLKAIAGNDIQTARNCWKSDAYYSLESGCSEICLQRVWGTGIQTVSIQAGQVNVTPDGRDQLKVKVSILCPDGTTSHEGEILLDTANQGLPWAHWKIIQSSVGGTIAEPWCK